MAMSLSVKVALSMVPKANSASPAVAFLGSGIPASCRDWRATRTISSFSSASARSSSFVFFFE
jgi:hypothetical protein